MPKKLLLYICSFLFIILNHTIVVSNERNLIPIKKPKLTEQELKKKVLINILKPLKKPKLVKQKIEEKPIQETVKKESTGLKLLLPKKKPLIAGKTTKNKISKSKFYKKKDFGIAKKAFSEMKKAGILTIGIGCSKLSGGTYVMWNNHDVLAIENPTSHDILFSGKRVTTAP